MKYLSVLLIAFLVSCGGNSDEKKSDSKDEKDTTENETKDSNAIEIEEAIENPDETSIEEFEKAEGGMSFCDCVKKVQELDDKMMADETTEEEMEAIMAEKEKLVDGECKVIKMGGQDSPEDRAERQRKAKACLTK